MTVKRSAKSGARDPFGPNERVFSAPPTRITGGPSPDRSKAIFVPSFEVTCSMRSSFRSRAPSEYGTPCSKCRLPGRSHGRLGRLRDALLAGWTVDKVDDARSERLGIHQFQRRLLLALLEEALAASHEDGMHHEPEFVDQAVSEQRAYQGAAAGDHDVLAGLPLQFGDLPSDVSTDQGRVLPLERPFQGCRDHVLLDAVHQHGVRGGETLPDRLAHLVVEVWEVPLVRRLHDAVQ